MVCYRLLVSEDGTSRAVTSHWPANRSFVAQDFDGRSWAADAFF
jgi:hypothetical protein